MWSQSSISACIACTAGDALSWIACCHPAHLDKDDVRMLGYQLGVVSAQVLRDHIVELCSRSQPGELAKSRNGHHMLIALQRVLGRCCS